MGISYNTSTVRDGLVLHLDAANRKSYPGTGTAWNDLSGNGNNATLVNDVAYSTNNKGYLIFDGTNDYAIASSSGTIPYGAAARTLNIWFYTNTTTWAADTNTLFFYGSESTGSAFGIDMSSYPNIEVFTWGGSGRDLTFSTTYPEVGWQNIAVSYDGATTILIYENGTFTQTLTLGSACNTTSSSVYIGSLNPSVFTAHFDGNISQTSIYNRVLTPLEIKRNFEALRGRYSI